MSDAMRSFVESRVASAMLSEHPGTPISFQNVPFRQPKNTHYICVHILDGDAFQAEMGRRFVERTPGVLQIDVVAPKDAGTVTQNAIAKTIGDRFRSLQAALSDGASVSFRSPSSKKIGEEGEWYVVAVSIPYHRDLKVDQAVL